MRAFADARANFVEDILGLLDEVLGQVAGTAAQHGATADHSADLMNAVVGMLAGGGASAAPAAAPGPAGGGLGIPGGLGGLVNQFEQAGLGSLVNSWVGNGPNQPATPAHIEQGLGADTLSQLARKAGVSPQVASALLAVALPILVNKLTPNGQVPPQSSVQSSLGGLLGGLLTGR
jgi:uncharacterized protein YidB (DUF937 family)